MRVLVWENKYGRDMYVATTAEELEQSAMKILQNLILLEYIYKPQVSSYDLGRIDMDMVALSDEEVAALPTESLRNSVLGEKKRHAILMNTHNQELQEYEDICKVARGEYVDNGRGQAMTAWSILQGRNGYEYESFELETVR